MKPAFCKLIAGAALLGILFAAGPTGAAMKMTEALDGNWTSPDPMLSGRGISVDYIPRADGSGTFFAALFTYLDGVPYFITIQGDFLEHEFMKTVGVFQATGGTFGNPFPGVTIEQVGTAKVTAHSCTRLTFEIDMDDDETFDDVDLDLEPVARRKNTQCVYDNEFDGCPDFASAGGSPRSCVLNGVYTNQDIVLTNETSWVLDGLVRIGDDNANSASVTIEPGTVLTGAGGTDYLYVSPGSKIFANGLPWAPIVLTSPNDGFAEGFEPSPGDLGGLVISGNAPCNTDTTPPFTECASEFDPSQRFGGDDETESSGELSYFQIRYAGIEFMEDAEVNSFTFQAVGSGTTAHHLQAYRGQDDGIEFFGGTANVDYLVVTEGGDDAVDWDLGWSGKMQYGLIVHGEGFGEDHGIEGASNPDDGDLLPRAMPVLSHFTFIGDGNGGDGIELKQGSGGQIWNTIVTGFPASCINITGNTTYAAAGTPATPSGVTAFSGVIVDCDANFVQDDGAPWTTQAFFNAFPGNAAADPMLDGYMPAPGSPALTGGQNVGDDYFNFHEYRGAFGDVDWTAEWTYQPGGGN